MSKQVVFISGLGANERAFERIGELPYPKIFAKWFPNKKEETLSHYAWRMIDTYDIKKQDDIVGLSFGGLLAQEIAKQLGNSQVILISSFTSKSHLIQPLQFGLKTKLYKLTPSIQVNFISRIVTNFLNSGTKQSQDVLMEMLEQTDFRLMRWSIDQIAKWKTPLNPRYNLYSFQGTKDRIVNPWETENRFLYEGGSHFLVYERADEVTIKLNEIIR